MTKNIIFVDIDGPLLPPRFWLTPNNSAVMKEAGSFSQLRSNFELRKRIQFDPVAVWMFNTWSKYSDAQCVISSNWDVFNTPDQLIEIFELNGLKLKYHKDIFTPKKMTSYRCNEVMWWIEKHQKNVDNYLVVDDDWSVNPKSLSALGDDFSELARHVVFADFENGLFEKDFEHGCKILNIDLAVIQQSEF